MANQIACQMTCQMTCQMMCQITCKNEYHISTKNQDMIIHNKYVYQTD